MKVRKGKQSSIFSSDIRFLGPYFSEILDKLKALSPSSSESESTKSKPSKALRKRQRRLDFVLSYQQENDGESFWHALKQPISLSMDDTYVSFGPNKEAGKLASAKTSALILTDEQRKELDAKVAGDKKLEIKPKVGRKTLKKAKKAEREKTKGDGWFGMPATEMTEEVKRDLEVLQMRGALDPKRFYKKNDMSVLPKYFQVSQNSSNLLIAEGLILVPLLDRAICRLPCRFLLGQIEQKGQEAKPRRRPHGGRRVQEVQQAKVHRDHRQEGQVYAQKGPAEVGQGQEEKACLYSHGIIKFQTIFTSFFQLHLLYIQAVCVFQ